MFDCCLQAIRVLVIHDPVCRDEIDDANPRP
jgi:hypothetical protein